MTSTPDGDEGVDELADRLLVAGNGARGEDDGVAGAQLRGRMLVLGHARERRARLALAAGGERQNVVARQALERVHAEELRHAVEHAAFARDRDDALHRAPQNADLPTRGEAGLGGRAQARDVGGEGGDDHPALRLGDRGPRSTAATSRSDGLSPSRSTLVESQTSASTPSSPSALKPRLVGRRADDRGRVDLPVAAMDDQAGRRADRERRAFRDRMGDRDEFDVERSDLDAARPA